MRTIRGTSQMARRASERGYNLVEMLIAIALLGTVMLSVLTLFFLGRSNVYSGKQMTRGVAIATQVLEDLAPMSQKDINAAFGITAATTLGTVDVDTTRVLANDTYTNSILRTTKGTITASQDVRGLLAKWKSMIETDRILSEGYVTLVIAPRNPNPVGATLDPGNATTMRVRVIVRWVESFRPREVIMDTVKTNRP